MGVDLSQARETKREDPARVSFEAHVELLRMFLTHREAIVEKIEAVLNAQRKPAQYLQDRPLLSRLFEDCFFGHAWVSAAHVHLRGQLDEAYCAQGFTPRQLPGLHNDLIHPAEMMIRGFHFWEQTRWPGRNGRVHYTQTLFNVYLVRCLELLSMRLWDYDPGLAGERLRELQALLDELWKGSPGDQPRIVHDARWLIPLAQSLPTDKLVPYLEVIKLVGETLPEADALEVQKAQVRMLGGHLTSQIRHYSSRDGLATDDRSVVLRTRTSNALDFALLIQGLVTVLNAYERAAEVGDEQMRLDMAAAIFQGVSVDPELFLNRLDLLGAYSMIESIFIEQSGDGKAVYSGLGLRHLKLLEEYDGLVRRLIGSLRDDFARFRPVAGRYSSYGVLFGTPSVLTELMAFKTLQRDADFRFGVEDVFDDRDTSAEKLAWVDGLRKMPHVDADVQRMYDYPQQFAQDIYNRIAREMSRREEPLTGRLYVAYPDAAVPELPVRYFCSSDKQIVDAQQAEPYDEALLLRERQEGHFLVSYKMSGGWIALKKDLLTEVLGAGEDAKIAPLPGHAAQVLRFMCVNLVTPGPSASRG